MFKKVIRFLFKPIIKLINLIYRVKIIDKEKLPKEGPVIIALNHRIYFDIFFVMTAYRGDEVVIVGRSSLKKNPFIRFIIWIYDVILVDRDGSDSGPLKRMLQTIKKGKILIIFPEGTRNGLHKNKFESGTAYIALRTGTDIVPIGINGPLKVFSKGNYIKVGDKFNLSKMIADGETSKNKEEVKRLNEILKNQILDLVEDGFYDDLK